MIPTPTQGYFIYTKSNCSYCKKAKQNFPQATIINCDNYLKEDREGFLLFIDTLTEKKPRTFPMIFYNQLFLGGHDDTKHLCTNACAFNEKF